MILPVTLLPQTPRRDFRLTGRLHQKVDPTQFVCIGQPSVYNFKNAHFDSLSNSFLNLPLSSGVMDIKSQENLDYMWEVWNDMVFSEINSFVPLKKPRDSNSPPWINGELLKAIRKKKTLWRLLKKNPNNAVKREKFRSMRHKIKMWCRLERRNYLTSIANEVHCSTKLFWSFFLSKEQKEAHSR